MRPLRLAPVVIAEVGKVRYTEIALLFSKSIRKCF